MASFRTHISFGIALGAASVFALVSYAVAPVEWSVFILVALAVIVGAISPDIDSDSGIPYRMTFASLSVIAGGLASIYAYVHAPENYQVLIGYPITAMAVIWCIIGPLFKKFTQHRGMAHSIPAAMLAGLIVFSLAHIGGFDEWSSFLVGLAFSLGYILHLVLDEVCSAVNFHGTLFVPNKALGSALKLFSQSRTTTVAVYLAVFILVAGNFPALSTCVVRMCSILGVHTGG